MGSRATSQSPPNSGAYRAEVLAALPNSTDSRAEAEIVGGREIETDLDVDLRVGEIPKARPIGESSTRRAERVCGRDLGADAGDDFGWGLEHMGLLCFLEFL
jgi:hypothetical protein